MATNQDVAHVGKSDWEYKSVSEQARMVRGYSILAKGDTPQEIGKDKFSVPSQSSEAIYTVQKINGKWICNCADYTLRKINCKHCHAVRFWLELKEKVEKNNLKVIDRNKPQNCPYCKSIDLVKSGKRFCKQVTKQRYQCGGCKRKFIAEKDFERMKGNAETTTLILDLFFKGLSTRQIQDHLKQFYELSLDHSNILRRIQKFSTIINDYVKTLNPEVSDIWNTDEMKIQAGGKWKWLWNCMDKNTRFLITRQVSDKRMIRDSRKLFIEAKRVANKEPAFMVTDGCHSYSRSINKELPTTKHLRLTSIRDKRTNNNSIERLNGSVRDRIKTFRGMQNKETADIMTYGIANYYNFIRPHEALDGKTPALASGIKEINMEGNRWEQLLKASLKKK